MSDVLEAPPSVLFDELADEYGYDVDSSFTARMKCELVLRYMRPEHRVLDVGCANGLHMRQFARHCSEITGVDSSPRMIELARERLARDGITNSRMLLSDAARLDVADGTFDLAYSYSTLLLVPHPEAVLAETVRVLRPGGVLVADISGRRNLSYRHWRLWYRSRGHFDMHAFTLRDAVGLLDDLGLERIEMHALGFGDQWRYVRGLNRTGFVERALHPQRGPDRDYRLSNLRPIRPFANRWFFVCRKRDASGAR